MKTVVWTDGSSNANGMYGRGGWAAPIEQAGTVRDSFRILHVWEFKDGRMSRENIWLDGNAIVAQLTT